VRAAVGASSARIELQPTPRPAAGEVIVRLPTRERSAWLNVAGDAEALERARRLAGPLAGLLDVALERERVADEAAQADTARRADVAKTAVLHAISHDLRSPRTAITTAVAGLRQGDVSSLDREELFSVLEDESARLVRLVDDLLDLCRIESGAVHPRTDWCDPSDAAACAAELVRARHGEHPIVIDTPRDLPLVHADSAQLERVFENLLDNAIRHSPPGAPVVVRGGVGGGRVTLRVLDEGRGMPASLRSRVFEPFTRGRGAGAGSGLGLAICRGFVEANGGRITVQSGVGRGSAFSVSFPLVEQPAPVT
jgi:two-component system, OmpR family, sensor histidine kinase KdpD